MATLAKLYSLFQPVRQRNNATRANALRPVQVQLLRDRSAHKQHTHTVPQPPLCLFAVPTHLRGMRRSAWQRPIFMCTRKRFKPELEMSSPYLFCSSRVSFVARIWDRKSTRWTICPSPNVCSRIKRKNTHTQIVDEAHTHTQIHRDMVSNIL